MDIKNYVSDIVIFVAIETASRPGSKIRAIITSTLSSVGISESSVIFLQNRDFNSMAFLANNDSYYTEINLQKLKNAYAIYGDNVSRSCMIEYIRMFKEKDIYRLPSVYPQYFIGDLFELRSDEVIIDCGAYNGSTLTDIFCFYKSIKHVHSFEPNPASFAELGSMFSRLSEEQRDIVSIYPYAVSDKTGDIKFSALDLNPESSSISANGNISIKSVSLDDIFKDKVHPTLIKMDVEGAELSALEGTRNIIECCRPILAVCLYHEPQDIWEIPEWLSKHCHNYYFYLRKHRNFRYQELVAYAIPKERRID